MPKTFAANDEPLSQRAYRQLREQVLDGRLTPGQRLPLRSIASSLGMSMAPVGEAFRELARDGLIEMEPGWGARVRKIDLETLRNQHILRLALECEGIRQCTDRATDEQIGELAEIASELDDLVSDDTATRQQADQLVRGCVIAYKVQRPPREHSRLVEAIR